VARIDPQHPVLMASPEKALCDYVTLKRVEPLKMWVHITGVPDEALAP